MSRFLTIFFVGGEWGGYSATNKSKCQDLPKFEFFGRGGILQLKSQSAKIYLNWNFSGGGILQLKSQSAKINDNSGRGGYSEAHLVFCMGSVYVLHLLFLNIILYFINVWVTTYIYYYFLLFLLYCLYFLKKK